MSRSSGTFHSTASDCGGSVPLSSKVHVLNIGIRASSVLGQLLPLLAGFIHTLLERTKLWSLNMYCFDISFYVLYTSLYIFMCHKIRVLEPLPPLKSCLNRSRTTCISCIYIYIRRPRPTQGGARKGRRWKKRTCSSQQACLPQRQQQQQQR